VWKWTGSGLLTTSLKDVLRNKEYAQINPKMKCDWNLPGAISDSPHGELVSVSVTEGNDEGFSNKFLQIISTIKYPDAKLLVQHVVWVYPDASRYPYAVAY
jgi:hypothetical protein